MKEELIELLKKHIKHSLCKTPISIQSRVYFDGEEISSLRIELPQTKPLSDEEIQNIWYQHEKWLATVPLSFARAIEERHGIK